MFSQILLSLLMAGPSFYATSEEEAIEEYERVVDEYIEESRRTNYYDTTIEEEDGCTTITLTPRTIEEECEKSIGNLISSFQLMQEKIDCMTGKEREQIFKKAEECIREGYDYLHQAERIEDEIYDISAKDVFRMIVCDALAYCYGGTPAMALSTCGIIITEIVHSAYYKLPEFRRAKDLIGKAEKKFQEALLLEEMLWYDEDAEDWM